MIPKRMVDEKIQDFTEWSKELIEEDRLQHGLHSVKRPATELLKLYGIYVRKQSSSEYMQARKHYYYS